MTDLQAALRGETPPLVTPFDAAGEVDHAALEAVVAHVESGGVDGLFPCGTTGEFASLTAEEQAAVIETVVDGTDDLPVVAGVSATAVEDAVARANAAADAGADAAVLTPPYFHTSEDPAGVEAFLAAVADRSPLPLVLYNIPGNVGTCLEPATVASLAGAPTSSPSRTPAATSPTRSISSGPRPTTSSCSRAGTRCFSRGSGWASTAA